MCIKFEMQNNVEQGGLYQNCKFHQPRGIDFDPRVSTPPQHQRLKLVEVACPLKQTVKNNQRMIVKV